MRAITLTTTALLFVGSAAWCLHSGRAPFHSAAPTATSVVAAAAPPPASDWFRDGPCEIQPLRASHRNCGVDPRLAALRPLFDRPPWTAFSCFEPDAAPSPAPAVELRARGRDGRRRLRVRSGRTTYTLAERPAETALVATRGGPGDVHILALRCE